MPTGTLSTWNDDRGFGFIAPTHGGRNVFVHVSAFPRDGSRPTVGESLTYEIGLGKDGKPQAVRVYRDAVGQPSTYRRRRADARRSRWSYTKLIGIALLIVAGVMGYSAYDRQQTQPETSSHNDYRCDGRTRCSQMNSCDEAKFFLENCRGAQMDGDGDGVPCEQQWCGK
jgi:cold shock CspA family protein